MNLGVLCLMRNRRHCWSLESFQIPDRILSQKSLNNLKKGIWPLNLLLLIHMFEQTVNPSDANHLTSFQIKLVQLHV